MRHSWTAISLIVCGSFLGCPGEPPANPQVPSHPTASAAVSTAPVIDAGPPALVDAPLDALPYTPSLDLTAMDKSADPCVSLYQYACAGWMKNNPIPPDQSSWGVYAKVADDNRRFLWGILASLRSGKTERTANQQKIGDYFTACMSEPAIDARGAAPLKSSLDAIDKVATVKDLAGVIAQLQSDSGGDDQFLFGFGAQQDYENARAMVANASAGGLGLPDRDYYTKTDAHSVDIRQKYTEHVARMMSLLGDSADVAKQHAATIMQLETQLATASLTLTDKRDPKKLAHKTTIVDLKKSTPDFDWGTFTAKSGVPRLASLNVSEPAFFKAVQLALTKVPVSDWKTYLRWHLVHAQARFLSSNFERENFEFFQHTLRGTPAMKPRWKRCVGWVDSQLGEALGEEFVRRAFGADTRARVLEMTTRIEKAMETNLQSLTWMGPETRRQALAKLHAMVNKIGYPEHYRDYGLVTIAPDDFAGNVQRAQAFEQKRTLAKVGRPVDRAEWFMTPPTVNAYYDAQMNDMNFPAGVLQPPLFDVKMDDAPNYGNTGATIGHELTHGFDDEGRQFDAKGNLKDWWTKADAKAFEERAKCVTDQYAQYTVVDEIKINSQLSQGEDIADLGGTMLAYVAWQDAMGKRIHENIDGFTPEQRFFIGAAQWVCENQRPENLRADALTNPHSPGRYRIDGVMVNMPEYERSFSCKPGAPMAPQKRCRVW